MDLVPPLVLIKLRKVSQPPKELAHKPDSPLIGHPLRFGKPGQPSEPRVV